MERVGRPTKYDPAFCEVVTHLCLLGATDKDLAKYCAVNIDTLYEWRKVYPEFSEAIKAGREIADANVAKSLYQKAIGYVHKEEQIVKGKKVTVTKKYAPDVTACIFWLKNRRSIDWRDQRNYEHTGKNGAPIEIEDKSEPNLEMARRIAFLLQTGAEEATCH